MPSRVWYLDEIDSLKQRLANHEAEKAEVKRLREREFDLVERLAETKQRLAEAEVRNAREKEDAVGGDKICTDPQYVNALERQTIKLGDDVDAVLAENERLQQRLAEAEGKYARLAYLARKLTVYTRLPYGIVSEDLCRLFADLRIELKGGRDE